MRRVRGEAPSVNLHRRAQVRAALAGLAVLQPGHRLAGHYEVTTLVALQSGGEVWRGTDLRDGSLVAIKLASRSMVAEPVGQPRPSLPPQHDNLCRVRAQGRVLDGRSYAVTDWVEGRDLVSVVRRPLPPATVAWVGAQVASALAALHRVGLLHGDVRIENIRLQRTGRMWQRAVLLDLGLAAPAARASAGADAYTLANRSPEVAAGAPVSVASDLYALGCVLAQLAGLPCGPRGHDEAHAPPAAGLALQVDRLLAADPRSRPASAVDVAAALAACAGGSHLPAASTMAGWRLAPLPPRPPSLGLPSAWQALPDWQQWPRQRKRLQAWLAGSLRQRAVAVAVVGPARSGRTRLLASLALHARDNGWDLWHGLAPLAVHARALPPLQPLGLRAMDDALRDRSFLLARSIVTELKQRRVLWLIDDASRLDELDADVVRRVIAMLGRAGGPGRVALALDGQLADARAWSEMPDRADAPAVLEMELQLRPGARWRAAVRAQFALTPEQVEGVLRLSAGHPQTLVWLLEALSRRQVDGQAEPFLQALQQVSGAPQLRQVLQGSFAAELQALLSAAGPLAEVVATALQTLTVYAAALPLAVLREACTSPDGFAAALAVAVRWQVVVVSGEPPTARLAHEMWADAVRARGMARPAEVWQQLAHAMQVCGTPSDDVAAAWWRAGQPGQAWPLALPAMEAALAQSDLRRAGRLLADAEAFGETMAEEQWAWVLLHHAEILLHQGRMSQARARVDELRALDRVVSPQSPAAQWTARAALLAARIGERIGDTQLAREGLAEALRRAHDQPRALAEANLYAARIRARFDGPEAAIDVAQRAEQLYAQLGDAAGRERALTERALYFVDAADAARWCAMLDPEPPVLGPVDVGRRLYALAQCHAECGDFARAMVLSRRAAEVLETAGHIVGKAAAMSFHAIAARRIGQFEVAEAVQRELLALRADQGSIALMATTLNNLADVLLCAGRPLEALPLALRSQAVYARMAGGAPEATGCRTLAEILLVLGKWQQAADSVQRSLSGKAGIRMASIGRTACRVLACAAAGQGRYRDAARLLADPLMTATRFGDMVADEWFPLVRPLPAAILVHPLGGTQKTSDGLEVTFPAGAVHQRVAVVLRRLRLRPVDGRGACALGWQLDPPGLDLAQPVTVVVPLPPRGQGAAAATLWMRRRPRLPWTLLHRSTGDEPAGHAVTVTLPTLGQLAWFSDCPGT